MYIVLGVLYESYIHPVTILSTLPTATVGALAALLLAGSQLGVVAIVGIILLIGIVKKNAIMMIAFFFTMPIRRMMPTMATTPSWLPARSSAASAPTVAVGSVERIVTG